MQRVENSIFYNHNIKDIVNSPTTECTIVFASKWHLAFSGKMLDNDMGPTLNDGSPLHTEERSRQQLIYSRRKRGKGMQGRKVS